MSKRPNNSDRLTMELMQKYRDGTLSPEEEAWLNQLSSQDPFVADALEGTQRVSDGKTYQADVADLRKRLIDRTQPTRRLAEYLMPVAASLALLLVGTYLVYMFVLPSGTDAVVNEKSIPSPAEREDVDPGRSELPPLAMLPPQSLGDTLQAQKSVLPQTLALVQEPLVEKQPLPEEEEAPFSLSSIETEAFDESFSLKNESSKSEREQKSSVSSYARARAKSFVPSVAEEQKEGWYMLKGQVVDEESGNPIPGANVLVKDTTLGTITDVEGRFSLSVPDHYKKLRISIIGFESSEVAITRQDSTYISMTANTQALSEVIVSVASQEADQESSIVTARPQQGMRAYRQYLRYMQRYPDNWQEGDKEVVKLSFFVQPNGELSDFTIEKSAGDWLDEEAIRLIKEGPGWEAAIQNGQAIGQEVKVRVRFKK